MGYLLRAGRIAFIIAVAAFGISAASSSAALYTDVSITAKVPKPGAAGSLSLVVQNTDNAVVPQPINKVRITSKVAKFTSSAVARCSSPLPGEGGHPDLGDFVGCPKNSKVGTGTWNINTGTPGAAIPDSFGLITGVVDIYNYKATPGLQAALLLEIVTQVPVPNAHQYVLARIGKSGVLTVDVPKMADLPPVVKAILSPPNAPRVVSLTGITATIKSPKPKNGKKPFFTLKNDKRLDFAITLDRD